MTIDWVLADLLEYEPPPDGFNLVVVLYLHLPAADRRLVHRRAAQSLATGGTVLVIGHDRTNLTDGWGGPQDEAILFSPADVVEDLHGFDIEEAETVLRPVPTTQVSAWQSSSRQSDTSMTGRRRLPRWMWRPSRWIPHAWPLDPESAQLRRLRLVLGSDRRQRHGGRARRETARPIGVKFARKAEAKAVDTREAAGGAPRGRRVPSSGSTPASPHSATAPLLTGAGEPSANL